MYIALIKSLLTLLILVSFTPKSMASSMDIETSGIPVRGKDGMVSSAHPLATKAGVAVLVAGGNAFDASVAIAATLNVVEPMMSGIGGYGTIVVYSASENKARFLNCSGRIPIAVDSDVFRAPTPSYLDNRRGAKAVSTPGNVNCWQTLWKNYGRLRWQGLFENAVRAADEGFVLGERNANAVKDAFQAFPEHAKSFYGRNGVPLKANDLLIQKDLANTLRLIARQGATYFYRGQLAKKIDEEMRRSNGFLSLRDLHKNQAEWWEPISINYRGYKIVTASPPANSFDMLVRLGIMSRFDNAKLGHNSAEYLHRFAEATKIGFRVRLDHAGDPDIKSPPLEKLLSEGYWKDHASTIDLNYSKPFEVVTSGSSKESHTTHFVVADRWGNVVSATQTLGNLFGARIMPAGTGVWLNNSLEYSTFEPKGNPMDAFPGRHKLSGDCPALIFHNGKLWAALGTPGGHTIGQTVPQMIINLIDFRMDIQDSISAPRISFIEPETLAIESAIPVTIRNQLAKKGHKLSVFTRLGNAHGLTIEYDKTGRPSSFSGAADPRGEGQARGILLD